MIDLFGHLGYVLLLFGQWLLVHRRVSGWLFRLVGGAIWLVLGIILNLSSIYLWTAAFLVMDFRGWRRWAKREEDLAPASNSCNNV